MSIACKLYRATRRRCVRFDRSHFGGQQIATLFTEATEQVDQRAFRRASLAAQAGVVLGHAEIVGRVVTQAAREATPQNEKIPAQTGPAFREQVTYNVHAHVEGSGVSDPDLYNIAVSLARSDRGFTAIAGAEGLVTAYGSEYSLRQLGLDASSGTLVSQKGHPYIPGIETPAIYGVPFYHVAPARWLKK